MAGGPSDVAGLARRISDRGFVVFNAPYRLALQGGGYPESIEDAACAVSVAHASASEFGGDPDRLIVAGYSAGAHLGSIVSLAAEEFPGDCVADAHVAPAGFAGIAGTYDTDPLGILMLPFFGTDPNEDPEPWQKGNPITHLGKNANLVWTLVVGANDLTRGSTEAFHTALTEAGYRTTVQVLEGVNHFTIVDQSEVVDVIVELAAGL